MSQVKTHFNWAGVFDDEIMRCDWCKEPQIEGDNPALYMGSIYTLKHAPGVRGMSPGTAANLGITALAICKPCYEKHAEEAGLPLDYYQKGTQP